MEGDLRLDEDGRREAQSGAQAWEARATGLAYGVTILRGYGSQNSVNASCSACTLENPRVTAAE